MAMVLSMDQKLMSNCLMCLEENINAVLYNLISNYLKDLICSLEVENNNSILKRHISTKPVNKRKTKIKKKIKEGKKKVKTRKIEKKRRGG